MPSLAPGDEKKPATTFKRVGAAISLGTLFSLGSLIVPPVIAFVSDLATNREKLKHAEADIARTENEIHDLKKEVDGLREWLKKVSARTRVPVPEEEAK